MQRIILHGTRLRGLVEAGRGHVIHVDGSTPLLGAFQSTLRAVRMSPVELVVACHGFMTHYYDDAANPELRGGIGLQLCQESLMVTNVSSVSVLKNAFSRIWLMACGPAGTHVHESRPFCRELAAYADTTVIASDRPQLYFPGVNEGRQSKPVLRFGAWEGSIYEFAPDGRVQKINRNTESPLP